MTIQVKAIEQYFPEVLFIMMCRVVLTVESRNVTIQLKAAGMDFPVVLFIMVYKVALTVESVDEILKCGHSNESY